jgi:hypothetical protein
VALRDYEITINGQTFDLTLAKGDSLYSLAVAPGDYNADGYVDAADYIVWRQALDSTTDLRADVNANGVIDVGDFDVWRSHFGDVYASGAGLSAIVPGAIGIRDDAGLDVRRSFRTPAMKRPLI